MTTNPPASDPPDKQGKPDKKLGAEKPALPDRSGDETDIGWGDRPETGDDDRLNRDRPPHWEDY
jgi:hypothetical protein